MSANQAGTMFGPLLFTLYWISFRGTTNTYPVKREHSLGSGVA